MLTGKIRNMTKENVEFMLNFEEIVKTKVSTPYRYKIYKCLNPMKEDTAIEFKILDTKENKIYKIIMDDFIVSVNPFMSNKTYIQLMNRRFARPYDERKSVYQNRYARYLQSQLVERLTTIAKKVDKQKIQLKFDEIIDYIDKSLGFKDENVKRFLKSKAKDIEQLIKIVASAEFKNYIKESKKFSQFLAVSSQPIMKQLENVYNADTVSFQDRIENRIKTFLENENKNKHRLTQKIEK